MIRKIVEKHQTHTLGVKAGTEARLMKRTTMPPGSKWNMSEAISVRMQSLKTLTVIL